MTACALSETVLDPCWEWWLRARSDGTLCDDYSVVGTRALGLERRTTPILRDVNDATLVRSNCVVYAYRSTLVGDNLLVIGRGNTVIGRRCTARGSDNVVFGPFALAHGARSEAIGRHACVIRVGGVCVVGQRLLSPRTENAQQSTLAASSDGESDSDNVPPQPPLSSSATRPVERLADDEMPRAKSHDRRHRRRRRRDNRKDERSAHRK